VKYVELTSKNHTLHTGEWSQSGYYVEVMVIVTLRLFNSCEKIFYLTGPVLRALWRKETIKKVKGKAIPVTGREGP
jgi:hypothetical protein